LQKSLVNYSAHH